MAAAPDAAAAAEPPRKLGLAEAALVGLLSSMLSIAVSVARSKVTAQVLGPEGVGRAAEVLGLFQLAAVPLAVFTGPAVVSALAKALGAGDRDGAQRAYDTAGSALVVIGAPLLAGTIGSAFLLPESWRAEALLLAGFAAVTTFFTAFLTLSSQALLAAGAFQRQAAIGAAVSAGTAAVVCTATWQAGLPGQFAAATVASVVAVVLALPFASRAVPGLRLLPRPSFDRAVVKELLAIGTTSLIAGVAMNGALNLVRLVLAEAGGDAANGQFQAAWSMGATYFGVVLGSLGSYVFPRFAAARTTEELSQEVEESSRFVLKVAPPVILLAIGLRGPVTHLLYAHGFDDAAGTVGYQMAGDLAKALSWVYAGPLLYRGKKRAFLLTETLVAALLAGGSALLVPWFGVRGTGYAYLGSYAVYLVATALLLKQACGVAVPFRRVVRVLGGAAALAVLVRAGEISGWVQAASAVAGAVWGWRTGLVTAALRKVGRKLRPAS